MTRNVILKSLSTILSLVLFFILVMSAFPVPITANAVIVSETESNDSYASANSFSLNSTISGKMGNSDDKDYFKITPSQNGKISLTFSHNYSSNSEIYWNITMYSYSSGNYTEFYSQRIYANSGEMNTLASVGASSGTTYYIVISTYYNATVGFSYSLKNDFTSTNYYEKEINNDYSSATSMSYNQTYGGVMNDDDDDDFYKFAPSQNGKISLNFTHAQSDNSEIYWYIAMFEYSSGIYTEFYNQRIYANSGETNKLASIGVASGKTYYIKISTYYNATVGFDYNLKNEFTSTNYYEKEINDNYSSATPMSFNQTYGGVMNDDDDIDVYKFSPTQDGKISLTFSHDYSSNSEIYWNIVMFAYLSGNYTEFYNQRIYANSGETNKLSPIGVSSDTMYYIKIYTYYNATVAFDYNLKNEFTATDYYEKEINKEYTSATPIQLGATYGGVMNDDDDVDIFKITLSSSSTPVNFSHDYVNNSEVYWYVKIIDASTYSEKFSTRVYGSDNNGIITTLTQAGTYYIHISTYYSATINYEYSILVGNPDTTKPSASISSSNNVASSQTITLTMSDNVGLAGYYWGTSSSTSPTFTSISGKSYTATINNYSTTGTSYLTVKDTSGNIYQTSKVFYKTTLNANGGSVTPASVFTMSGNSFTFPTPTKSGNTYIGWSTSSSATSGVKTLSPTSNNTYYAVWSPDPSDTTKPSASISSSNNVASSQTITLTMSDNIGLAGYYWGTNSSTSPTFTSISGKNYTATINNYSTTGTSYLTVKDTSGNIYQTSKVFYKTTLNANGGSVTPASVFTMSGNSFTFPTPTKSGNTYIGWSTSSSATSGVKNFTPTSNATYYAIWQQNPIPSNAKITVESKTASSGKEVNLAVSLSENPGLAYLKLKISYNTSALEFISAQNTGLLTGTFTTSKSTDVNPYVIQWMGADNSNGNGTIANLKFRVKDNAAEGNYTISLTPEEAYNSNYDDVTFTVTNGAITVKNVIVGDVDGNGTINGKDGILLAQYLADWNVTIVDAAADCNGDGTINGKDGILLAQYLADWDVTLG